MNRIYMVKYINYMMGINIDYVNIVNWLIGIHVDGE